MWVSLLLVGTVVVIILLLALLWRRECKRTGVPVTPAVLWFSALLGLIGVAVFMTFGLPSGELRYLSDVQKYQADADQLIAGAPLDKLKDKEVPLLGLIHALQERLGSHPSAAGWQALSSLYVELAREAGPQASAMAVAAARHALVLATDEDASRLFLAQRLIEADSGKLNDESRSLLEQVLARHPDYDGAWLLLALSAAHSEEYPLAEHAFRTLIDHHPDDRASALLKQSLAKVKEQQQKARYFAQITVTVKAGKNSSTGGTLFVSIQKQGQAGMPLAAKRVLVNRLPLTVVLERGDWLGELPDTHEALVAGGRYAQSAAADVAAGQALGSVPLKQGAKGLEASLSLP